MLDKAGHRRLDGHFSRVCYVPKVSMHPKAVQGPYNTQPRWYMICNSKRQTCTDFARLLCSVRCSEGEATNALVAKRERGFTDRVEKERFFTLSDEPWRT